MSAARKKPSDGRSSGQRSRRRRGRGRQQQRHAPAAFWGDPARMPDASEHVRITTDPAAVPRSLGEPPLPGHEAIADHYFAVVYERAVTTAAALAAAGGLMELDEVEEQLAD